MSANAVDDVEMVGASIIARKAGAHELPWPDADDPQAIQELFGSLSLDQTIRLLDCLGELALHGPAGSSADDGRAGGPSGASRRIEAAGRILARWPHSFFALLEDIGLKAHAQYRHANNLRARFIQVHNKLQRCGPAPVITKAFVRFLHMQWPHVLGGKTRSKRAWANAPVPEQLDLWHGMEVQSLVGLSS